MWLLEPGRFLISTMAPLYHAPGMYRHMDLSTFPCPGTEPELRAQLSCLIRGCPCQRGWELEWLSLETCAKPSSPAVTFLLRGSSLPGPLLPGCAYQAICPSRPSGPPWGPARLLWGAAVANWGISAIFTLDLGAGGQPSQQCLLKAPPLWQCSP